MKHFALLLMASFGYARAMAIRADRIVSDESMVRFFEGDRLVHQIPLEYVQKIQEFDNQLQAQKYVDKILQQRAGAATFHVQEYGVAQSAKSAPKNGKPRQGGFLAEGITVNIAEMRSYPKKT